MPSISELLERQMNSGLIWPMNEHQTVVLVSPMPKYGLEADDAGTNVHAYPENKGYEVG